MAGLDAKMRKFIREQVPKLSTAQLQEQVTVSGKFARKKGMSAGAIAIHREAVRQSKAELAQRGVSVARATSSVGWPRGQRLSAAGKRRQVGM